MTIHKVHFDTKKEAIGSLTDNIRKLAEASKIPYIDQYMEEIEEGLKKIAYPTNYTPDF